MQVMSHREYLTWLAWLDEEWNNPDRHDWYLMQIACEVRRVLAKNPSSIRTLDFELPFEKVVSGQESEKPEPRRLSPANKKDRQEMKVKATQSRWIGMMGMTPKVVKATAE